MVTLILCADINLSSDINFSSYLAFLLLEIVSGMIRDENPAFPAYFPCCWSAYNTHGTGGSIFDQIWSQKLVHRALDINF